MVQEVSMNHIINKRFFCNFLQKEGALEVWKKTNRRNDNVFLCESVDMWVILSDWGISSYRSFFWPNLHSKWCNYLKQINYEGINSFD